MCCGVYVLWCVCVVVCMCCDVYVLWCECVVVCMCCGVYVLWCVCVVVCMCCGVYVLWCECVVVCVLWCVCVGVCLFVIFGKENSDNLVLSFFTIFQFVFNIKILQLIKFPLLPTELNSFNVIVRLMAGETTHPCSYLAELC